MSDKNRGIYRKYHIERTDGSSAPGGKHECCAYFVLDLTHDKYAIPALIAYENACKAELPKLAADLLFIITSLVEGESHSKAAYTLMELDAQEHPEEHRHEPYDSSITRLSDIIDNEFGMQPHMSPSELLTFLEQELAKRRLTGESK